MLSFAWKRPCAFRMRSRMRSATGVPPPAFSLAGFAAPAPV